MSKKEDIYAKGNAVEKVFSGGGSVVNFSLNLSQLIKVADELNAEREKRGLKSTDYINFNLNKRREKDEYGNTHVVKISTWMPDGSSEPASTTAKKPKSKGDDLPF